MQQAKLVTFTCPRCNRTLQLASVVNRKLCPECSYAVSKEIYLANYAKYKETERIKRQERRAAAPKPPKPPISELDAYIKQQSKQCKTCKYHYKDGEYEFCDFVTWSGQLRDRGEGPGQCGSFTPKETKVKRKRNAYVWR